ncbi:hypothetical protein E5676_scaffold1230G00010 [Cucumis melo var. makuwa]|nr:hypothetical protein E6C27_scaffold253G00030 [Cucumis melo var. makuwa]TYK25672.1 hypothetical protein E5676_scaffold1230G00010 [Cucumis melo var. makuwa]
MIKERPRSRMDWKKLMKEESFFFQSLDDQRRLFFLSMETSSRGMESQEDLRNLRWGFEGEFGGMQVCGVWRKRKVRMRVAMAIEANESLLRKRRMWRSIVDLSMEEFSFLK